MSATRPDPMALADVLARKHADLPDSLFTTGTVYDASSTTHVSVDINNSVVVVPKIASYSPVVGDVVVLLGPPGRWYCVGSLSPTTAGSGSGTVASHTHAETDVTSLQTDLAGKAAASHTHAESAITNLTTDLAGKAAATHSHAEGDVTGLASDLAAKVGTSDARLSDSRAWSLYTPGSETSGQVPQWNGTRYVPGTISTGGTTDSTVRTALFGSSSRTVKPDCRARMTSDLTLAAGANTQVTTWTVETNPDSAFTTGGTYTVPTLSATFRWRVQFHGRFPGVSGANRLLTVNRNATTVGNANVVAVASESNTGGVNGDIFDCIYEGALSAGDVLRFFAYSNLASSLSAASVVTTSPPGDTWVSITLLGPA